MRSILSQFQMDTIAIKKSASPNTFSHLLRFFYTDLKILFSDLAPFFYESRTDENLLLLLLERRKILNLHLGPSAIETLLESLFPRGISHLQAIIHEGFTRRGFSQFLLEKEFLLEEISWKEQ